MLLLALGLMQMTGDLLGLPAIKAIAAATGASPAPRVFSAVRGLETYSSEFFLDYVDADGAMQSIKLTSVEYSGLRGPYNRRNVFGAAMAYGPVLKANPHSAPMFRQVLQYAFCGEAPLANELGLPEEVKTGLKRIRIVPAQNSKPDPSLELSVEILCDEPSTSKS